MLQALDAAGKDGTIRHVMSGVNPQGVSVHSFKVPSSEELDHDYLWRFAKNLPRAARSASSTAPTTRRSSWCACTPRSSSASGCPRARGRDVWKRRYRDINDWERYLIDNGFTVVKLFLNLSREEQRIRFLRRIDLPEQNWKFSAADVSERGFWDDYQKAFNEMLTATSTEWAPWYVIPADRKWFARICAGAVIADALIGIDPRFPRVAAEKRKDCSGGSRRSSRSRRPRAPSPTRSRRPRSKTDDGQEARAGREPQEGREEGDRREEGHGDAVEATAAAAPDAPRSARQRGQTIVTETEPAQAAAGAAGGPLVRALTGGVAAKARRGSRHGASAAQAAELLRKNGPNVLPEEKPEPGWRRFLAEYRAYMQIILVVAAVVSLIIGEWSTGVILIVLTVFNAVVGLRQEGKAESAMNALKSMMKATARVRRDGAEAEIPIEEVVVGDIVLISAGDEVPADGRILEAHSLDIDESALTGESTPASKETDTLADTDLGPGDQTNMAFMNTPVTHGSGTMIVTGTGAEAQVGKIAGMLAATAKEQTPLTSSSTR